MVSSIRYAWWLLVLPIIAAALLNYPLLQQSLQRLLPEWAGVEIPSVTLPQGKLVGKVLSNGAYPHAVEGFLGIPYAAPPVGDLRFANPVALTPSNQTFETTEFGPK